MPEPFSGAAETDDILSNRVHPLFSQGLQAHQSGNLLAATEIYQQVLKIWPKHFDSLHLSGVIALQNGDPKQAIQMIEKALAINDQVAEAYNNLGAAFSLQNDQIRALACFDKAVALNPNYLDARMNRCAALEDCGRFEEALTGYQEIQLLVPGNGNLYYRRGKLLEKLKHLDQALTCYDQAIALQPDDCAFYVSRGGLLAALNCYDAACASFNKAIELRPEDSVVYFNQGNGLLVLHHYEEAIASYDRCLQLLPTDAQGHSNRGNALLALNRYEEALASYDKALQYRPDIGLIHNNRANLLQKIRRFDEAIASYEKAWQTDPQQEYLLGMYLHTKMKLCDWSSLPEMFAGCKAGAVRGERIILPFAVLALVDDPQLQLLTAQNFIASRAAFLSQNRYINRPANAPGKKIRVGYYSSDFYNHATSYLMAELFEQHDHQRFEFYLFSFGPSFDDAMRQRILAGPCHFVDISNKADDDIARLSRDLEIDIAVDLKGYTGDARPDVFIERCAPIQVNYLGYPGTLGMPTMDYIIADHQIISPENRPSFSEKIVYLPDCYQVNQSAKKIAPQPFTRQEEGLPETGFIFCSFNNSYKILPQTFDVWMDILQAVKGSVLWLLETNATVKRNLQKEALVRGIDAERLIFAKFKPMDQHLARTQLADLFLDTLPCNAHTTASDALWAGLPVLTCRGKSFAARVAASLLQTMQLAELITDNYRDYQNKAIELATDPEKLRQLKTKLENNRRTSPLFNTQRFARHIEAAYQAIYDRHQQGLAPEDTDIKAVVL